jgi:predicted phosphohydrolase
LHNNYYETEGYYICGTRAWEKGAEDLEPEQDEKVYNREKERLERSLQSVGHDKEIIAVTHYNIGNNQEFVEILKKYNVKLCIYGHLHGKIDKEKLDYERDGIRFLCTSCDLINFLPIKIHD